MALPAWVPREPHVILQEPCSCSWTVSDLSRHIDAVATALSQQSPEPRRIGILADNSPDWIAVDLATQYTGKTLVPLPSFFSPSQLAHVVRTAGVDTLFCADSEHAKSLGFRNAVFSFGGLRMFERSGSAGNSNSGLTENHIQKVTFTSGTTAAPKGVCLTLEQQLDVARGLAEVMGSLGIKRHLSLLPLSLLLENVAGIYTPFMIGATCICPSLADVGLKGASEFNAEQCLSAITQYAPESVIVLPQMLQALVAKLDARRGGDSRVSSLKFMAVGGARTPQSLICRARELGLPVYEGYGLSECASVVALNVPGADRVGTVGQALPGARIRIAPDGEIEVWGRHFCGYLGIPEKSDDPWLKTGDLGSVDAAGFISIVGRKKNILITSFGRNVSPEWPENLLLESPLIAQAVVFGEARPDLVAILVPRSQQVDDKTFDRIVIETNRQLPDYARIRAWVRAPETFAASNGLATANGRIRRDAVWSCYAEQINKLYETANEDS